MPKTDNLLLGLDLALGLAARLTDVMHAAQVAAAQGRDLTSDELQRFADADDRARERLADKIAAARRRRPPV